MSPDVVVIGAGVIGLSTAAELARRGLRVTIVDQSVPGSEASWAGAGMLPPGGPHATAIDARLRAASSRLWPEYSAELRELTGLDNEYRCCGAVELRLGERDRRVDPVVGRSADDRNLRTDDRDSSSIHPHALPDLRADFELQRAAGIEVEWLSSDGLRRFEPAAATEGIAAAYALPGFAQVRNPRHLKALIAACERRNVTMLRGAEVHGFARIGSRVTAAITTAGELAGGVFVVTAGAWSQKLLAAAGSAATVVPVRGQIVLLHTAADLLRRVLLEGPRYIVPRIDGRLIVGSTEEQAGFCKQNTAAGVAALLEFAQKIVPALSGAVIERCWAGLRPKSIDSLPYLGPVDGDPSLLVAAGHFRNGLQLSPITARIITAMVMGEVPPVDVSALRTGRTPLDATV